jgi:ABC-type nitrate/sulfonate/bicarbonate transport system substrate-binding protein
MRGRGRSPRPFVLAIHKPADCTTLTSIDNPPGLLANKRTRRTTMGGKALSRTLAYAAIGWALSALTPAAAQTKLTLVTFAGATNLPVWIANEKGFFAKEGLDVTHEITRGSTPQMQGLMDGKYQFASSALDNTIGIGEGQGDVKFDNFDVVAIMGVHSGMNKIVTRPETKTYADIKGKAIASDALNSGYGLVLVKILASKGLVLNKDYTALAVGSTPNRIAAMQEGKAVAAVISPPEHMKLLKEGYNLLGDATEAIGAYQGSAFIVRKSWAQAHEKETLAFIRSQVAATDYAYANKAGAIEVMKKNIKGLSDAEIEAAYTEMVTSKGGLNRGARINMEGVKMLLTLRNEVAGAGKQITDANKYIDLSFYEKATGGK